MNNIRFALLALSLAGIFACTPPAPDTPKANKYESCCGATPVEFTKGNAYVYVPNVFTPNGDGVNDWFAPSVNGGIVGFDAYLIYTPVGDTVVFATSNFDPQNIENTAWDGMKRDGTPYIGAFRYELSMFYEDGTLYQISGTACRVECGQDAAALKNNPNCFYPSQINPADGKLDKTLPSGESNCFN